MPWESFMPLEKLGFDRYRLCKLEVVFFLQKPFQKDP